MASFVSKYLNRQTGLFDMMTLGHLGLGGGSTGVYLTGGSISSIELSSHIYLNLVELRTLFLASCVSETFSKQSCAGPASHSVLGPTL